MKTMDFVTFERLRNYELRMILGGDGGPVELDSQDIDMPDIKSTP